MTWSELRLLGVPREDIAPLSSWLFDHGCQGMQEAFLPGTAPAPRQPWDTGPLPAQPSHVLLRAWFEGLRPAPLPQFANSIEASWHDVPVTDWETAWREGLGPIVVDDDLVIAPPWDAPPGALIIEPGQGFGSGHHPSTLGALRQVQRLGPGLGSALDVGCGSGILALAAARLGMHSRGIDIHESAVSEARRHAGRNRLTASFATTPLAQVEDAADLVLANLHAELLVELADDLCRLAQRYLVQAGILLDKETSVVNAYRNRLSPLWRETEGEWVVRVWERR